MFERSVIVVLHSLRATLPIICSVFLAAAMISPTSLGITATNFNNYPPSYGLAANSVTDISPNSEGNGRPKDESRCQSKLSQPCYLAHSSPTILCQRLLRLQILLRRVYYPHFGCVDLIIYIPTGRILRRIPAPCNRYCL